MRDSFCFARINWLWVLPLLWGMAWSSQGMAESDEEVISKILELSLGELLTLEVTSVSKKSQKINDSAAAVFVITREDIRRSGARHVADLLRMAPGIQVDTLNAHGWRVSARGSFNGVYVNKLLVLVDGRSVYNLQLAGVFWDAVDMLLEDIERIEVIRGPGGALWGANAVNGIVNIITRHARDTQGGMLQLGGGNRERAFSGLRYGGQLGRDASRPTWYRFYARSQESGGLRNSLAEDDWRMEQGGFRFDGEIGPKHAWTLHGDLYHLREKDLDWQTLRAAEGQGRGNNLVGHWSYRADPDSTWKLQAYYDEQMWDAPNFAVTNRMLDLELQHQLRFESGHELLWGLGWHWLYSDVPADSLFHRHPDALLRRDQLYSALLQMDFRLRDNLHLIAGGKFEHNAYTGVEIQPNLRMLWQPRATLSFWGAISRAVRTPSQLSDHVVADMRIPAVNNPFHPLPLTLKLRGDPDLESESILAWEGGVRGQFNKHLSWDLALFYNDYRDIITRYDRLMLITGEPGVFLEGGYRNEMQGETYGLELALNWRRGRWRMDLAYHWLDMQMHLDEGALSQFEAIEDESTGHGLSLRSGLNLDKAWTFDAWLRYKGAMYSSFLGYIPSHFTLDLRLAWQPRKNLELSLVGQDLLNDAHFEYGPSGFNPLISEVTRGVYGQVKWWF